MFGKVQHGIVYVQDESEDCYEQKVLVKTVSGMSLCYTCQMPVTCLGCHSHELLYAVYISYVICLWFTRIRHKSSLR